MILLLGATGYVGQAFSRELRRRGLSFIPLTRKAVDYTNFDVLFNYVRRMKPEFVINAAGYAPRPDMETCETAHWEVLCANVLLPQTVARVCLMTNTPWGHVSSTSIYTGAKIETGKGGLRIQRDLNHSKIRWLFAENPEKIHGFTEWDQPNFSFRHAPCNFYSGSKALAEEAIRGMSECYLWRPGILFEERDTPHNLLSKLQNGAKIYGCINSFSHLGDFVQACLDLWERRSPFGIYNVINSGAVTTRTIVELIQQILKPAKEFEFDEDGSEFCREPAGIPHSYCIMNVSKLLSTGVKMRSTIEALKSALQEWRAPGPLWSDTAVASAPSGAFSGVDAFEKLFARQI